MRLTVRFEDKIAARGLEGTTFDTALPQDWWNLADQRTGMNPAGHVVWSYPPGSLFGYPRAIDEVGDQILGMLAGSVR